VANEPGPTPTVRLPLRTPATDGTVVDDVIGDGGPVDSADDTGWDTRSGNRGNVPSKAAYVTWTPKGPHLP